jgi:pimeloyl-ACP methyl ester carboxylesterase
MKLVLLFLVLSLATHSMAQKQHNIYLFPGQGSDEAIFKGLSFDSQYNLVYMELPTPDKGETLHSYAHRFIPLIDTTTQFSLIGVSLGGMICSELTEVLSPSQTILISSAKCAKELPKRYLLQKRYQLNKTIPSNWYSKGALFLQPIVEPDRNQHKETFKRMLGSKNGVYLKRTADMIINWDKESYASNIYHIHGDQDHTIPLRHVNPQVIINDGSHMMVLTRAHEVSLEINRVLTY